MIRDSKSEMLPLPPAGQDAAFGRAWGRAHSAKDKTFMNHRPFSAIVCRLWSMVRTSSAVHRLSSIKEYSPPPNPWLYRKACPSQEKGEKQTCLFLVLCALCCLPFLWIPAFAGMTYLLQCLKFSNSKWLFRFALRVFPIRDPRFAIRNAFPLLHMFFKFPCIYLTKN